MSYLTIPRVAVEWSGKNLTAYTEGEFNNEPLVYDVSVDLSMKGANPTGSFKWNPTGAAFRVYEQVLKEGINNIIKIRFYYAEGKQIEFDFVWAGERIVYGNDMVVTIMLKSELDGLINTDIRTTTQANDEKPASFKSTADRLQKQFGLDKYKKLVRTSEKAEKDLNKATLETLYRESETFGSGIANLVEANGNYIYANNHDGANLAVFAPFSMKPYEDVEEPSNNQRKFEPNVRYGYLLGPGIIDSFERTQEWQPPQQNNGQKGRRQQLPSSPKPTPGPQNAESNNSTPTNKGREQQKTEKAAPGGTRSARPNNGIRNANNPEGPDKQLALQSESQCKLNANIFMCPSVTGIKPNDIIYVPSLKSNSPYIEDWIVENVSYQQTAGGVEISIGCTRIFAREGLMNPKAGEKFQSKAKELNQEGRAGLEAWRKYAWDLPNR